MSEEKPIYSSMFDNTLCSGAYNPPVYRIFPSGPATHTLISIDEYNAVLAQDQRFDAAIAVIRNVTHYLIAKQDIGELSAVEDALLLACEQAMNQEAV